MPGWKVDATTKSILDSRAVVDSDSLGQWDLVDYSTGRKLRPVVEVESIGPYTPVKRRMKRADDGKMVPEKLNKLKITFKGKRKYFICNQVNRKTLQTLFGPIMQDWIGKRIRLLVDEEVKFGKQKTGGLRISTERVDPRSAPDVDPLDNEPDPEAVEVINEARAEFELEDGEVEK